MAAVPPLRFPEGKLAQGECRAVPADPREAAVLGPAVAAGRSSPEVPALRCVAVHFQTDARVHNARGGF